MYLSNYMEEGFLNAMRGITFAAPPKLYCGLFTSSPTETGMGGVELNYAGHTRMEIEFSVPAPESGGIGMRNTQDVTYPKSPADAGTVRFLGIFDSQSGGNMYLYGAFQEEKPVLANVSIVLLKDEILYWSKGEISNAYKRKLLNIARGISLQGITPYYALFNGDPEAGGMELAGENYKREEIVFSSPVEDTSGMTIIRNTEKVNFNRATTNWGNWSWSAIMDAESGGECVWKQQRATPFQITKSTMAYLEPSSIALGVN